MKEGKIIEIANPREAIRRHQETAPWEYREEAAFWYAIAQDMDKRFFNGLIYPDGKKVPAPYIAFADLRNQNTIAEYDLRPDEYGIIGKITFNTAHYVDIMDEEEKPIKFWARGRYSQGETLLHEYLHLWQEIGRGKYPVSKQKRVSHNKEWHDKAKELGLNPEGPRGIHTRPATPGSPIDVFLKEHGIYPPRGAYNVLNYDGKTNWATLLFAKDRPIKKGKSTLHPWICPECGQKLRATIKGDIDSTHDACGVKYIRAGDVDRTIFRSP